MIDKEVEKSLASKELTDEDIKKKKKKDTIISTCIAILGFIIVMCVSIVIISTYRAKRSSEFGSIVIALEKLGGAKSFVIDSTEEYFKEYSDSESMNDRYSIIGKLIKKDSNYNASLSISALNNTTELLHFFTNKERLELIFNDGTVYSRYKDIFNVAKTYVPALSELSDDLSQIDFDKYTLAIEKRLVSFSKSNYIEKYYNMIEEFALNYIVRDDETTNIMLDGKEYNLDRYYITVNARDFIEFEVKLLKEIKNDKKIRQLVKNINIDLLNIFESSKDYEKIRMTKDEFNKFKYSYSNELLTRFDEFIDMRIDSLGTLYTKVNNTSTVTLSIYISQDDELKQFFIYYPKLVDNTAVFVKSQLQFTKLNNVKSKEIVPSNDVRVNLATCDRSDLYLIVDKIKGSFDIIISELSKIYGNEIKIFN